jgi:hypothetical protein
MGEVAKAASNTVPAAASRPRFGVGDIAVERWPTAPT